MASSKITKMSLKRVGPDAIMQMNFMRDTSRNRQPTMTTVLTLMFRIISSSTFSAEKQAVITAMQLIIPNQAGVLAGRYLENTQLIIKYRIK